MTTYNQLTSEALFLCDEIARFSTCSDRIERFCLSVQMKNLHQYLKEYFSKSLVMEHDAVGNVLFVPIDHDKVRSKRRVVLGSHLDTVSNAGRYDGILGVVIGLLCAREFSDENTEFHAVGFADEEGGRFGCRFLGSLNFIGQLPEDYLSEEDSQGVSLQRAMLNTNRANFSRYLTDDSAASFIEIHIEQGLSLHQSNCSLGVVEQICGQAVLSLTFHGRTAHAVNKWNRQDALISACELVSKAHRFAQEREDLHITFGYIDNSPNQSNVVSDKTLLKVDIRHTDDAVRLETIQKVINLAESVANVHHTQLSTEISEQKTVLMDGEVTEKLHSLCQANKVASQLMTSFAGHDALIMSTKVPTGFIFLRDDKGISHHPQESVDRQAIADAFLILKNY